VFRKYGFFRNWPETEVLKRPLFGSYWAESRHNSDIAELKHPTADVGSEDQEPGGVERFGTGPLLPAEPDATRTRRSRVRTAITVLNLYRQHNLRRAAVPIFLIGDFPRMKYVDDPHL